MEVHAIDTLSGREEPLEIDADATVSAMKRQCGEAFGFGEDVELSVSGQRVACDGAERVSNVAAFSGGCRVGVVRGVAEFVAQLRSGVVSMVDIPVWAQQRRECVLALIAMRAELHRLVHYPHTGIITIEPHWVHPSLHDDKEVMLRFVECDPKVFVRASATLRSDADVVIAALQRDASMWYHVEDKSLQDQRSVALLAVPHCANSAVWLSDKAFVLELLETAEERLLSGLWPYVSKALQQDKEVAMEAIRTEQVYFGDLSETLRGDKDFVMEVLEYAYSVEGVNVLHFNDLSEALKRDNEVVMEVLCHYLLGGFHQLSATLQQDKEIAMKALRQKNVNFSDLNEALREDKEFVMEALLFRGVTSFHELSATLQQDKQIVLRALGSRLPLNFSDLSAALKQDKEVVMKALDARKLTEFHQLSATLQEDKEVAIEALCRKKVRFGALSEALRGDKDFVMEALKSDVQLSIGDLSEELQQDEDVLRAGERQKHFHKQKPTLHQDKKVAFASLCAGTASFSDLSEELRGDKEFIRRVLESGSARHIRVNVADLSEALRGDKGFIMSVLLSGRLDDLYQLSETLKQDKEFAMAALRGRFMKFGDIRQELLGDKVFVMEALRWANHGDFHRLSPTLQQDTTVMWRACRTSRQFLQLSATLQQDKGVVMEVLESSLDCGGEGDTPEVDFSDLSEAMRGDKEVVMKALDCSKMTNFHHLSATLRENKEVIIEALLQKKVGWENLSEALQADKAFVIQAIAAHPDIYVSISGPLRHDKDVALAAIAASSDLFVRMVPALRDDLDVALSAIIRDNPDNFIYAGDSVRADKQAALAAFRARCPYGPVPVLLPFASAELQADREVVLAAVRANATNGEYASPALQDLAASGP